MIGEQCKHGFILVTDCYCDYSFHPKGHATGNCPHGCKTNT